MTLSTHEIIKNEMCLEITTQQFNPRNELRIHENVQTRLYKMYNNYDDQTLI